MKNIKLIPLSLILSTSAFAVDVKECNQWLEKMHPEDGAIQLTDDMKVRRGSNFNAGVEINNDRRYQSTLVTNIGEKQYRITYDIDIFDGSMTIKRNAQAIGSAVNTKRNIYDLANKKLKPVPMPKTIDRNGPLRKPVQNPVKPLPSVVGKLDKPVKPIPMPTVGSYDADIRSTYTLKLGEDGRCMVGTANKYEKGKDRSIASNSEKCHKLNDLRVRRGELTPQSGGAHLNEMQGILGSDAVLKKPGTAKTLKTDSPAVLNHIADQIIEKCQEANLHLFYTDKRHFVAGGGRSDKASAGAKSNN